MFSTIFFLISTLGCLNLYQDHVRIVCFKLARLIILVIDIESQKQRRILENLRRAMRPLQFD